MNKPKRDKYGRVIMEPAQTAGHEPAGPPPIRRRPVDTAASDQYDAPTIMARSSSPQASTGISPEHATPARDEVPNIAQPARTMLYRPSDDSTAVMDEELGSLPVGWLVVVTGPGRGAFRPVGYGWNKIGRSPDGGNRVVLDFDDLTISSSNHARINYNAETRVFKIVHQDGVNNTYVDGQDLDSAMELHGGERIRIGNTELLFVRLCGSDFEWD